MKAIAIAICIYFCLLNGGPSCDGSDDSPQVDGHDTNTATDAGSDGGMDSGQ